MLIIRHTIKSTAYPQDIWNIWKDVKNWGTWDNVTEYSYLDGEFAEGTQGTYKVKGGPELPMKLIHIQPLKEYVVEFKLFLARIVSSHYLSQIDGKTQLTQQIEVKGPLAFLYGWHLGRSMKKNIPQEMEALVKKAEQLSK